MLSNMHPIVGCHRCPYSVAGTPVRALSRWEQHDASRLRNDLCWKADPLPLFTLMAKGSNSILCLPSGFATAPLLSQILCASVAVMMITADHIVLHAACFISKLNWGLQKAFFA